MPAPRTTRVQGGGPPPARTEAEGGPSAPGVATTLRCSTGHATPGAQSSLGTDCYTTRAHRRLQHRRAFSSLPPSPTRFLPATTLPLPTPRRLCLVPPSHRPSWRLCRRRPSGRPALLAPACAAWRSRRRRSPWPRGRPACRSCPSPRRVTAPWPAMLVRLVVCGGSQPA